jgi:uncharacterized membrane protein YhaH (DUF805 family)
MDKMFLPLKRYADFRGRSDRAEYWLFTLGLFLASIAISLLSTVLWVMGLGKGAGGDPMLGAALRLVPPVLKFVLAAGTFIPGLAVMVRRLHDTNRGAGWAWLLLPIFLAQLLAGLMGFIIQQSYFGNARGAWGLLMLISPVMPILPIVWIVGGICALVLLVFCVLKGTDGDNRFGPPPGTGTDQPIEAAYAPKPAAPSRPIPAAPLSSPTARPTFGRRPGGR